MQARVFSRCLILGTLAAVTAHEALAAPVEVAADAPIVVAQAAPSPVAQAVDVEVLYPAEQAGVRAAAKAGPDVLRQYVQRTRMIYHFSYWDFAPKS
jgi:hypothetical protein